MSFDLTVKSNSNKIKEIINEQENELKQRIEKEKSQLLQKIDNYEKNILNKKLNEIIKELEINEQCSNKEREFKPIQFVKNESLLKSLINNLGTFQTLSSKT